MAHHFSVVVEALRRVECALAYHAAKLVDAHAVPPGARVTGSVRLAKEPELAAWYSPEELGEMASNLRACIQRHHIAMVKGYGDALRIEPERRRARMYHEALASQRNADGTIVRSDRSERETNRTVAMWLHKANESVARRLLKRKGKWQAWEVEPRVLRRSPPKHSEDK
jgi:hypothetical protein